MKIIIAFLISIICGLSIYSQTTTRPRSINRSNPQIILSDASRYEVISLTDIIVKLDRYTGKTYFYYYYGKRKWYLMDVRGGLPNQSTNLTPRYQIYVEGEAILLINNETGQTWVFYNRGWEPIED